MSAVTCNPDVAATALEDLLSQFDESPNVQALAALLVRVWQSLEDDSCVLLLNTLSTATGALLDRFGVLVGVPRDGRTDEEYRRVIEVTIEARDTSSTVESILGVISVLAGGAVHYIPLPPAAFILDIFTDPSPLTPALVADITAKLFELAPAGVGFIAVEVPPDPFAFEGPDGLGFDAGSFAGVLAVSP